MNKIFEVLMVNPQGLISTSMHVRAGSAQKAMSLAESRSGFLASYSARELSALEASRVAELRQEAGLCSI
jgi:hypothetical protein